MTGLVRTTLARFVPQGALLLSVLTFGSYAMGLVRDRSLARTFGAGPELDAWNAAFVLPELTLDVLIASGLTAPFVPIFLGLRGGDEEAANAFGQTILTLAVIVMAAAAAILFLLAPQTAALVAPGFDPSQRALYVELFRVMLVTPVVFAASIALGEVLVADRRFLAYGLAPLLYNLGIILGAVLLNDALGILGPALGAVLGALLHLGIRVWGIGRSGFRIRPRLAIRTPAVVEFVRLMLPKMASHPVEPITFLYFTAVATTVGAGSVTAVSFARNFQSVPVSLIGIAFSLAAFPTLSAAAAGDRSRFIGLLRTNAATILVLTGGAAIGLYAVSGLAIELLLGGGAFDAEDVAQTGLVLGAFALAVPFESLSHLLSRAIYATRNTLLQVGASLVAFALTVVTTEVLVGRVGIVAIPLGFSVGMMAKVALLGVALAFRLRRLPLGGIPDPTG